MDEAGSMIDLDQLLASEQVKKEYRKTFLLCMFQKICAKMKRNKDFEIEIRTLFRQRSSTKAIVRRFLKCEISDGDAKLMSTWFEANLNKSDKRKRIPDAIRESLYKKQKGKCAICGEELGSDWGKVHVDHIIPFKLVGDELANNYQDLCESCNSCKNAQTDFIFKSMLKLV